MPPVSKGNSAIRARVPQRPASGFLARWAPLALRESVLPATVETAAARRTKSAMTAPVFRWSAWASHVPRESDARPVCVLTARRDSTGAPGFACRSSRTVRTVPRTSPASPGFALTAHAAPHPVRALVAPVPREHAALSQPARATPCACRTPAASARAAPTARPAWIVPPAAPACREAARLFSRSVCRANLTQHACQDTARTGSAATPRAPVHVTGATLLRTPEIAALWPRAPQDFPPVLRTPAQAPPNVRPPARCLRSAPLPPTVSMTPAK